MERKNRFFFEENKANDTFPLYYIYIYIYIHMYFFSLIEYEWTPLRIETGGHGISLGSALCTLQLICPGDS